MTDESIPTERQQDVLRLHRAGRNPTEIGRELKISSQAVHGHFRRLRAHGLVEDTGEARAKPATKRTARNGRPFDPASALPAVTAAINEQRARLDAREAEIDAEIAALRDEKKRIGSTRGLLERLTPAEPAT